MEQFNEWKWQLLVEDGRNVGHTWVDAEPKRKLGRLLRLYLDNGGAPSKPARRGIGRISRSLRPEPCRLLGRQGQPFSRPVPARSERA
jgi:hypothetical protein